MIAGRAVDVVVPVLDGASTIGAMLEALLPQTRDLPGTRVLVVDNGSTDRTREIVRGYDVEILDASRRGPAAARNRGLRAARAEIVAHLDADTMPTRRWLVELVAPFADPRVILTAGRCMPFRPETPVERYLAESGHFEPENTVLRSVFPFAPSGNLAVRRRAALDAGGWCEEMPTAEDVDFSQRVLRAFDTRIVYCPRAVLFVRGRTSDDALCDQAWSYGQGAAEIYERYPEDVRWGWRETLRVGRVVGSRAAEARLRSIGSRLSLAEAERARFSRYHALWAWWWWRGFFSRRRRGARRARQ